MESLYPVKHVLRIDWSDLDYFGHVNNVSFFRFVQSARVNYWDHCGINAMHKAENIGPMLASSKCDFKKPLYYPGQAIIHSGAGSIGNSSFRLCHRIYNEAGELCAEAEDVIVIYDFNQNRKHPIPESILNSIESLEKREFSKPKTPLVNKIDLMESYKKIDKHWDPRVAARLNGQDVRLAKLKGEFVMHKHDNEDEMFYVVEGELDIEFRDKTITLHKDQFLVVPKGVEHKPVAREEVCVMLFEPSTTLNTGNIENEFTKTQLKEL